MPHKTKKQKLQAHQHRHIQGAVQSVSANNTHAGAVPSNVPQYSFSGPGTVSIKAPISTSSFDQSLSHIRTDIAKTLILALLACGTLISLSFVLH